MAYETGIAPNDLLDADPDILAAMVDHRRDLAKAAAKKR